jgi:peptidoglycan/xylan/chitin deacetylase (PgdA/CDA1 family)
MRVGRTVLYGSTLACIGLACRSILDHPVPLPVVAAASGALGAVVLAGVLEPRLAMYADVISRGKPRPSAPRVALTFDDGPSLDSTPRVLDALDAAKAKGTFFVVGRKLDASRKPIVRDMLARGHVVGCHSFAHDRLFALRGERTVRDDLLRALSSIEDATGKGTKLFRPPIGHTNPIIARVAEELGLLVVGFSVRALDGVRSASAQNVVRRVTSGLTDGAIVLMHDASEREDFSPAGPDALPPILEAMRARSLEGVTVLSLLA